MDAEMTTEQQPPQQNQQHAQQQAPQQAPTFDSAVNACVELRAAGMLTNEQFATVISALKNDNDVATMDITYTDAHQSCVSKKPTPLDLGVTQTTAASTEPASKEWEDLRAEELRFVRAELDALCVELRDEMDREEKEDSFKCYNCEGAGHMARNCTSSKRKDSFKCYNCEGAGHMARYCTAPKKKAARKSAGPAGSCGSKVMGPYPKRQGGGDYIAKRGPINVTRLFVLNNDIKDLLRFQATVHLRRETTTANALADMGGSDNFIAPSLLETVRRDRVRVEFGIGSTYKSELWFTVNDLEDYDLILGKPWFCQHNLQHTIDYVKNMMWIEDERGHHVLEGLPPMPLEREKEAQRLGLQTIHWKEVQREMRHGRALGRTRDLQWDHRQALETSRDQGKRGACDTEEIEGARDSSKRGTRDTGEGARDAKRSRDTQLFMVRLSTPQLEGTESDALEAEMRRLYPETFEPPTGVPKRRPYDYRSACGKVPNLSIPHRIG
jgi:hypothetical protein